MCWGIFPFLVPCLSRGIIWADSEQPVRVKYVSNPSCGLFKDRVSCVLGLLPQKLMIFLSRCIKAMLQKDLSVSCVCVLAGKTPYHTDTLFHKIETEGTLPNPFYEAIITLICKPHKEQLLEESPSLTSSCTTEQL